MGASNCIVVEPSLLASELVLHLSRSVGELAEVRCCRWLKGRSCTALPELQVIEAHAHGRVHYLTAGASSILDMPGYGLEFCLQAREPSTAHVEMMAMVAFLHSDPHHRLGTGHTMSIGRPIVEGSSLDRLLVSLPYPYGEEFEFVHLSDGKHARMLWLLPIHAVEEVFLHRHGSERLEEIFDEKELDYLDFFRTPVVRESKSAQSSRSPPVP